MFIGFANFYRRFIWDVSKIAVSLISILKITGSSDQLALKAFWADNNEVVGGGVGVANEMSKNLSRSKKSKNKKSENPTRIGAIEKPNFLTPNVKKTFNQLRQAFIKAPILRHFDLESHIRIKTDASGYAIGGVLSQLNFNSDAPSNDLNKSDFDQ